MYADGRRLLVFVPFLTVWQRVKKVFLTRCALPGFPAGLFSYSRICYGFSSILSQIPGVSKLEKYRKFCYNRHNEQSPRPGSQVCGAAGRILFPCGRKGGLPLNQALLLMGLVIFICILLGRFMEKIPLPSLLIFIGLGMLFGENGVLKIPFDDYLGVNTVCSVCLICIMFYGGFGTNLRAARPVLPQSILLSTLGVAGTAGGVAVLVHLIFRLSWQECLLIGGVISSTDAASVFNILRSRKLALKFHTDSLLEMESGSNDPMSFMLTTLAIALLSGESVSVPGLLARQLLIGGFFGIAMGWIGVKLLHRQLLPSQESHTIFLLAIMLLSYALPSQLSGNGYLSVYLCGIYIGNSHLPQKKFLVHFFDVLTQVSQVLIFFLLGLLVTPVQLPAVILPALLIMVLLTVVVRPLVCTAILAPFRAGLSQIALTSWAGLRGAASIVFAISAVLSGIDTTFNLYNLVFCIVLLSISIQGSLLPFLAGKLGMLDPTADVGRTFNDYQEDSDIHFIRLRVAPGHSWQGQTLSQLRLPGDLLVAVILRQGQLLTPTGATVLEAGDVLVLAARSFQDQKQLVFQEIPVEKHHKFAGLPLSRIPQAHTQRIILIKRGIDTIIPTGSTVVQPGDILVTTQLQAEDGKK